MEWRTLEWLPNFEVSESGDLRRIAKGPTKPAGEILKGTINPAGYRVYSIGTGVRGRGKRYFAHQLVCEAWYGPRPPEKTGVAHADGDPLNNHFTNLRWATQAENMADRMAHGNYKRGEEAPHVKLTWEIVDRIRELYTGEYGQAAKLARQFGTSDQQVSYILKNRIWVREMTE